jgi:PadR family transcriptional regulator, regulatory protein PadR
MNADARGPQGRGGPGFCGGQGLGRYRRSVLEVALLASLAESAAHGYELIEKVGTLAGALVCIDPGSMYRLLRAMEEEELVSSSWHTPDAGPSRRVYQISEQGLEALEVTAWSLSQQALAMQQLADRATQVAKDREVQRPEG